MLVTRVPVGGGQRVVALPDLLSFLLFNAGKRVDRVAKSLLVWVSWHIELGPFWEACSTCLLYTSPSPRDA
eukprot:1391596-Lingulodinium_polyedra.AAC.1